ncbi:hypothetical protein [Amphritea sp.]|uniref:hypothetical protein n=1 Tax=Amphritea sp. TaxID=1872502 RepID=UPI0025C6C675|nr:hypothetical protein [Amphritea sp.]
MRYTLLLFLALLTGCNTVNSTNTAASHTHQSGSCFSYFVCDIKVLAEEDTTGLKISLEGLYHPIESVTLWIDGNTHLLTAEEFGTAYSISDEGLPTSTRRFSLEEGLNKNIDKAYRARLRIDLQSYTLEHTLKKTG